MFKKVNLFIEKTYKSDFNIIITIVFIQYEKVNFDSINNINVYNIGY